MSPIVPPGLSPQVFSRALETRIGRIAWSLTERCSRSPASRTGNNGSRRRRRHESPLCRAPVRGGPRRASAVCTCATSRVFRTCPSTSGPGRGFRTSGVGHVARAGRAAVGILRRIRCISRVARAAGRADGAGAGSDRGRSRAVALSAAGHSARASGVRIHSSGGHLALSLDPSHIPLGVRDTIATAFRDTIPGVEAREINGR